MTDTPDTSPEAVDELVERMRTAYGGQLYRDCTATLRALSAERDAIKAELDEAVGVMRRYEEELRLIRMKDTGAVYDVLLRTDARAFLARHQKGTGG